MFLFQNEYVYECMFKLLLQNEYVYEHISYNIGGVFLNENGKKETYTYVFERERETHMT